MKVDGYKGPKTSTFNGVRFVNLDPVKPKSMWTVIKWRLSSKRTRWSTDTSSAASEFSPNTNSRGLRYTFINHSTFLIELNGLTILTDPIWSDRCSPVTWAGPQRVRAPGIRLETLPKINVVLISHNHYDHMDLPTLMKLEIRDQPVFLTGLGNKAFLKKFGLTHVEELDWWDAYSSAPHTLPLTHFYFVPARHWSRRGWDDFNKTLWGGFVIQQEQQTLYFAGDTGYGRHFREIHKRFPKIDLSFLPIGAYEPRWFMHEAHINPEEAVRAHLELRSQQSVGMHFGTFQLSNELIDAPMRDLETALKAWHVSPTHFIVPEFGKTYEKTP